MEFEHVIFLEATLVQEHIDTLTSGIFATLMLLFDSLLTASDACFFTLGDKLLDFL